MVFNARLSLGIPPSQLSHWEEAFDGPLASFLSQQGFPAVLACSRPLAAGYCGRAFSFADLDAFEVARRRLAASDAWRALLAELKPGADLLPDWRFVVLETEPSGHSVEAGSGQRQGDWLSFGVDDGLGSALIMDILEDGGGRLWMRTYDDGICCFDGQCFVSYTVRDGLPSNKIWSLLEDDAGAMWFGCDSYGLCRFDGQRLTVFSREDGLASDRVCSLFKDGQGRVWAVSADGWPAFFDGHSFIQPAVGGERVSRLRHESSDFVHVLPTLARLGQDSGDRLWLVGPQERLYRLVEGEFVPAGADPALRSGGVRPFVEGNDGDLWFSGTGGALRWVDGGFEPVALPVVGSNEPIHPVVLDAEGRLWCNKSGKGNSRAAAVYWLDGRFYPAADPAFSQFLGIDGQGRQWFIADKTGVGLVAGDMVKVFSVADGLPHGAIRGLCSTREGEVWLATWGGGICRYEGDRLRHFGAKGIRVEAIGRDAAGRVWWGAWDKDGLHCWDGTRLRRFGAADGMLAGDIWCMCLDRQGRMWFGGLEGLCCYDGEFAHFGVADGLPAASVWALCQDSAGDLWVGTQEAGACRVVDGGFEPLEGLPRVGIWSIAEDCAGGLWFGVVEQGVWHRRPDGELVQYTTADGLGHNQVWSICCAANGDMWFGTWAGGVSRYDGQGFVTYTTEDGLANNHVRAITQDAQGRLWFCTFGGGVCSFDGLVFQVMAKKDGLAHDSVQNVMQDDAGDMWFATESGVTHYRPCSQAPRGYIRAVLADRHYGPGESVEISVSQRLVAFELGASSFITRPRRLAYAYRLVGKHEDWRPTYGRRVEYPDLTQGTYRFEVKAVDRDLNYSVPATAVLEVVPDEHLARIAALEAELSQPQGLEEFVGRSAALLRVLEQIKMVAETDVTVLIGGETGTGKGLAARAIHAVSARSQGPFIQLNCGAIPEGLVESELFGHEKGAFTGAVSRQLGRFERAAGGTLFLDEIGDLPLASQRVLLHVLQEGIFQRVGGQQSINADVRVIAATNRDLSKALAQGQFRQDLFYRLSVFGLTLPPLRQRQEDLPLLVRYFTERFARHLHRSVPQIDPAALAYMQTYPWPGNVRELEHLMQRAVLVCQGGVVSLADIAPAGSASVPSFPPQPGSASVPSFPPQPSYGVPASPTAFMALDQLEKEHVEKALRACNGIVYGERGAARLLDVHPERLRSKMRKWGLGGARSFRSEK